LERKPSRLAGMSASAELLVLFIFYWFAWAVESSPLEFLALA